MLIVDSQIHLWENARMSPQHRQIPTYNVDDALKEMAEAGVDAAVIHPPSTLGEGPNVQAVEAVKAYPQKFCILGNFDLQAPNKEEIVKNWRQRPGMLGFRFTFNQPHQQSWWSDGTVDWFWAACEREKLPVGLMAGGHLAEFGRIAERYPVSFVNQRLTRWRYHETSASGPGGESWDSAVSGGFYAEVEYLQHPPCFCSPPAHPRG